MELSDYVEKLRGELTSITRFAGEDVARAAELLTETLESSVRLTLLDVLSAAAADITARLGDTAVRFGLLPDEGGAFFQVGRDGHRHRAEDSK